MANDDQGWTRQRFSGSSWTPSACKLGTCDIFHYVFLFTFKKQSERFYFEWVVWASATPAY